MIWKCFALSLSFFSNSYRSYQSYNVRGWLVVIGGFVFYMFHLGTHKALGVFIPYIAEDLELTEHLVGLSCGIGVGLRTIPGKKL